MKYAFYLSVLLLAFGFSYPAYAASFSLVEQGKVRNDRAEIGLLSESEHPSQASAEHESKRLINLVYTYRSQYPSVQIAASRRKPAAYCRESCLEKTWLARVSISLHGEDLSRLKDLALVLSNDFTIDHIRFKLSRKTRTLAENKLILKAKRRFAIEAPKGSEYDSIQVDMQSTKIDVEDLKEQIEHQEIDPGYSVIRVTLSQF